jgi:type IV pilus assembly protein PilC
MKNLLLPSIYVYRFMRFLVKMIWHAFLALNFFVYYIVRLLILDPFNKINEKQKNSAKAKLLRDEKVKKEVSRLAKLQKKQKLREHRYLIAEELKAKKRHEKDGVELKFAKREKISLGDRINLFFETLLKFPHELKKKREAEKKRRLENKNMARQILMLDFEGEDAVKSSEKQIYEYEAKDTNGKFIKGYFEAFSKVEVHSFLLNEGYEIYSIRTSKWINVLHGKYSSSRTKIKTSDLVFFLAQLSTYIKAGIPLVDSLKILTRQFKQKSYQRIFKAMMYDLTMGESFSSTMRKQGNAFPNLLVNMVEVSELTGELPEVLDDMEKYFSEAEATRKQMITAMTYPTIIFVMATAVMVFIMMFVVPKFVEIYESMDESQIPGITIFVTSVSKFLSNYFVLVAIVVVILIILFKWMYDNVKVFRAGVQRFLMKMPVFNNVIIFNEVTMFTKTFSSLLKHNVSITKSMDILNKTTNNEIYKSLISDTIVNLYKGDKISSAFNEQWAFPVPAYEMIVTGERTGQLPEMMAKVSAYYQEQHKNAVARIKAFMEPALIIFLTVGVGFIVLSIIIPMFGMYDQIQ